MKTSPQFLEPLSLFVDGASRGNPGMAGAGLVIRQGTHILVEQGYYLHTLTNNQAEYVALALGLLSFYKLKKTLPAHTKLHIYSDSLLLVQQIKKNYRVKNIYLRELYCYTERLLAYIPFDITHVLREKNQRADELANTGIDNKISIPPLFYKHLVQHCPSLWKA